MAGRFDSGLVVRVQQANDIVDVIGEHLALVKTGKEYKGLCPFHTDHRPSMYVSAAKQIFKCFACGAGGDVIKFVQLREGLGFGQALERLAQRAGIKIEPLRVPQAVAGSTEEADPKSVAKANEWALKHWQGNLWDEQRGAAARKYIAQRQISETTAKKWGMGLAIESWDDLYANATRQKGSIKVLEQAGLVVRREQGEFYDKFRNRLMFTIWDVTGRVIAFGGRTLGDDPAKYMNSPATVLFDKSNSLYGLNFARHSIVASGTAVVVEGYTDCMMAHQFGCENVVATLGTSLTGGHARLLRRYAKKIVLIFDSDVAGMEAANRALEVFLSERIDIRIASVPQGKDPCDFLLSAGKEAFENVIAQGVDVMEYKWRRLQEQFKAADTLAGQKAAAEEFFKAAAMAMAAGKVDTLTRGLIINRLAAIMGLSTAEVTKELAKRAGRLATSGSYASENQKVVSVELPEGFFASAQREVLEILLNEPKLLDGLETRITEAMFDVPILQRIASALLSLIRAGGEASLTAVLAQCETIEEGQLVVELAATGEAKGNYIERLAEAMKAFDEHRKKVSRQESATEDDETEALKKFAQGLQKTNLRNAGI